MKEMATALLESLKASPLVLALLLFNLAFIVFVYANARDLRANFDKTTAALLLQQGKMAEMLVNCGTK